MPSDWSVTPQDQSSIVITPASPESLGSVNFLWASTNYASATWSTANLALFIPFIVSVPTTIVAGGPYNGATATGNFDVGVYDDQQNKLVSAGSTAQSGTTAWQVVSLTSTTLNPGLYYMALAFSSASSTVFACGSQVNTLAPRAAGFLQQTSALPLPATATFATATSGPNLPLMALSTRTWV